jgi:hypothetical protein
MMRRLPAVPVGVTRLATHKVDLALYYYDNGFCAPMTASPKSCQ